MLHAVYSVTCGEFPTRNIILPYNSNYAAHRLIKWYWNNSVMSLKRYKSKYMRQNVLNYTFFFKRILEAMRKLYISLLVVESKFGSKSKKFKKINMNTVTIRSWRIVEQFLQICQSSHKTLKKVRKFGNFEKLKLL